MMARGPVEPVRMPPYHYQKQHVGGGGSASAEKGPAMTDPHKVANILTEDDQNECVCCGDNPPYPLDESGLCEQCEEEHGE